MTILAAGGIGCRKAQQPSPRAAADGAIAPSPGAAPGPEQAKGPGTESPASAAEPEPDWSGLGDDDVAGRSGITVDECRMALAEGDGFRITVCDFIREVNSLPPRFRARFDSIERRKELLEDMISLAVMEQEARRLGLDQDPETRFHVERILAEKMEAQLKNELRLQIRQAITPQDEETYFAAHADRYNRPELASAAHILVATEAEAQAILAQLAAPGAERSLFATLAAEKSLDQATKDRGGNLGSFTRPDVHSDRFRSVDPAIATAAFEMKDIGQIYERPVQTAEGFHVLKLMGRRPADVRRLDQVRPTVRMAIEEERFQEAWKARLQELQSQLGVELHPENLTDVRPVLPTPEELEGARHPPHGGMPGPSVIPVAPPAAAPAPAPAPGPNQPSPPPAAPAGE
ncbi:MAG: peptidyl-prolyl cis-trans isomerase [Deltaproteobacteria bacterium]|nr:peptidyl-prolyl cis-trans isomerase [Deltaproteobacteria bacterium]